MNKLTALCPLMCLCGAMMTAQADDFSHPEESEAFPGGAATSRHKPDRRSFSHPSANMPKDKGLDFKVGNGFFRKLWVSGHTATTASDGLGPLYNARSCATCHPGRGRGRPHRKDNPDAGSISLMLHLSVPPQNKEQEELLEKGLAAVIAEPVYGNQLQTLAVPGIKAEGRMKVSYSMIEVALADGETAILRKPVYSVEALAYGPLHPQALLSPRIAPQLIGLGLLEAVPEDAILAYADPSDANKDGISGKANRIWSAEAGKRVIGRFGHKAAKPTVNAQSQAAFSNDIGISTPLYPQPWGDCTEQQAVCRSAIHGIDERHEGLEASSKVTDLLAFYVRNLAVPKRRNMTDEAVLEGKRLFHQAGCAACHRPGYRTGIIAGQPEQSSQLIWPYTDLLLHDMGDALADHRPEGQANGREWRTAPLWGIGLTEIVSGHTYFLHDGRARNLQEAILWHGGEAAAARSNYAAMKKTDRKKLLKFVESL